MIIEFFGFPGSGKTTICNKFIKRLSKDDQKVIRGTFDHLSAFKRITYKFLYSFLCLFINPIFYIKNVIFFFPIKIGSKVLFADFLNVTYLYSRYSIFKTSDKIVVFDQGLIQAYWSILAFVEKEKKIYDYKLLFNHIDTVIILEIDLEQNLDRLFSREDKRSRVQKETEEMSMYFDKFTIVKEVLGELSIPYRLYLDSGKKVKKNVKKIRKKIVKNKRNNEVFLDMNE